MRLLGKYTFERLRDCMQGAFSCIHDIEADTYTVQAWFLTCVIKPHDSMIIYITSSKDDSLTEIGKITLS